MKRILFTLALLFLISGKASAQTIPVTASWNPNAAAQNVTQYTIQMDATTPVIVLPAACTATTCSAPIFQVGFGSHTVTLTAQNVSITGSTTLQSSPAATMTFSVNAVPLTV